MDKIAVGAKDIVTLSVPKGGKAANGHVGGFSDVLSKAVSEVNHLQKSADKAVMNVQAGHTDSLHEAMIALQKADVSFRTMMTVRNKVIEAYQEIMRMQV